MDTKNDGVLRSGGAARRGGNKKKKKPWIRTRHLIITVIAKIVLYPYIKLKYGARMEKFREQGSRQYLILSNHQTAFDQFFVGYAFRGAIYYVASEDIFSMGFISDLLRWAVNPIPIKKQSTDVSAVLNCMRVAREGGSIAIFPEGNRTYGGRTGYINPAIIMLAKKLALPIALMRIEGGYGVSPRWSDKVRRGKMRSYVSRVLEPEEYREMDDCAFLELIRRELYVDDVLAPGEYRGTALAEHLERAIYWCPCCGSPAEHESCGNIIKCKKCSSAVEYLPNRELRGVGFDFPYKHIADWYEAQMKFVNSLDTARAVDEPMFTDVCDLSEVEVYKDKKLLLGGASVGLFGDRIEICSEGGEYRFNFDEIRAITVCGKNKLNFYVGDKVYQLTGEKSFNALKYVNFAFRYKNIMKSERGEAYDEFLGL